jgi:ABC-type transport system involved in multi-copper enzyme maturation permease subunit
LLTFDLFDMFKSLIWKEWRENRLVFIGALIAILGTTLYFDLAYVGTAQDRDILGILQGFFMFVLLPTFAAGIASNLFAQEIDNKTLDFLQTLPISRHRIWWLKIGIGIILTAIVFLISFILFFIFFPPEDKRTFYFIMGLTPLAFSISLLSSICIGKSGTSMFTSVALSILGFILIASINRDKHPQEFIVSVWTFFIIIAISCFLLAYYLFVKRK